LQNNWRDALTFKDDVKKVSVADLNRVFNKYITNLTWVYLGNPAQVNEELFKGSAEKEKLPSSKVNGVPKN
jgi:zinc protease